MADGKQIRVDVSANTGDTPSKLSEVLSLMDRFQPVAAKAASGTKSMSDAARNASKSTTSLSKSIDTAKASTKSASSHFSNFVSSLMRIAKLRFLRGIIRSITSGFKEGTENIYQYSAALGAADSSHFATTMNNLATSFLYLKNSIGSVVAPLLGSLVPALQTVIGWVSAALNVLAQFFAVLNGQSTYTRAKEHAVAWKDIGAAAGGAAAAAKEYENTILGFDELNVLNDTPTSGGGGGGGGSAPDYSSMFEEAELATTGIAGAFNRLAQKVKPILSGIWDFASNIIQDFFDGLNLGADAILALLDGSTEAIFKWMDDMGKFVSRHPVLQKIYQGLIDASRWVHNAIDDAKIWLLDLYEWFLELPLVSAILNLVGFDVQALTRDIEHQKDEIVRHKVQTNLNLRQWELWSQGVDKATADMIINVNRAGGSAIYAFANMSNSADGANTHVSQLSGVVHGMGSFSWSGSNITTPLGNISSVAWNTGQNVWSIANALNAINAIGRVQASIMVTGALAALNGRYANGGYVTGYANGGYIPSYATGGINSADLFLANESGNPELVGRIGSRTAVANQGQMVEALAQGLERIFSDMNGTSNVEVVVNMDSVAVARASDRGQKALNRRFNVQLA